MRTKPWHWSRPSRLFLTGCLSVHSWQTAMLAHDGTWWHILARVGIQLSRHFIHRDTSFSGSIKFFHLKIALWLGLGKSWPLLAQTQKNTHFHKGMLLRVSFPKQTCKNYLGRNKDLNSWIRFRLYNWKTYLRSTSMPLWTWVFFSGCASNGQDSLKTSPSAIFKRKSLIEPLKLLS